MERRSQRYGGRRKPSNRLHRTPSHLPDLRPVFLRQRPLNTGTWFTTIALFVLASEVSGLPELAVGLVLVLRMFALALPQPFTGMLADRYSRKALMIFSNVGSAVCALALLLVEGPEDVVLYYAMVFRISINL